MHLHCQLYLIYFRVWFSSCWVRSGLYFRGRQKLVSNSLSRVSDVDFHDCFFSFTSKHFRHIPRFQKLKLGTLLFTSPRISHLTIGTLVVLWSSSQTTKHHTRSSRLSKEVIECNSHSFPIIRFHHQSHRSFFQTRTTPISSIPDTSLNNPPPHNLYPSRGNPSSPSQLKPTKIFSLLLWQHPPRSTEKPSFGK